MEEKSQQHWNERSVMLNEKLLNIGDNYYNRLALEYDRAAQRIEREIEAFYSRFSKENKMTYSNAKRILTTDERKSFMLDIDEYIEKGKTLEYSDLWAKELENASTAHRVTRLQSLQMQMRQQVEQLYSKYNNGLMENATNIFSEGYYRNIYEIQKAYGVGASFATLDTEKVKNAVAMPWTADDSNFSAKIWKDRGGLVDYLNKEMTQAFIRGESPDRMIKEIKKKFGVSSTNAARLVQTESAYFSALSKFEGYKALGYKKYIIVAVMDVDTSKICRFYNGEVFDIEDFKPGITANPFHPRCRTTTAPYAGDKESRKSPGMFLDHDKKKMYSVPEDMTYKEWYKAHVEDDLTLSSGHSTGGSDGKPIFVEKISDNMVDKKLMEYENSIKDNDYETAYAITETGDVYKFIGGEDYVNISGVPLNNAVITHNHPIDEFGETDSFGEDDFFFLQDNQEIKEFRVINPHYRYKLNIRKPLNISYNEIYRQGLQNAYIAKSYGEKNHYIMEYLKELGYIDYTWERTGGGTGKEIQ